jgi:hypothetical protein
MSPLTCDKALCQCALGLMACTDTCANVQTDAKNCGTCGTVCNDPSTCVAGVCTCPNIGEKICNGMCLKFVNDDNNCGACGMKCATGQTCCGMKCADTQKDVANCGACGTACKDATGDGCAAGKCTCGGATCTAAQKCNYPFFGTPSCG